MNLRLSKIKMQQQLLYQLSRYILHKFLFLKVFLNFQHNFQHNNNNITLTAANNINNRDEEASTTSPSDVAVVLPQRTSPFVC